MQSAALGVQASAVVVHGLVAPARRPWSAGAQELWLMGSVAREHVESSWPRGSTGTPAVADGFLPSAPPWKPRLGVLICLFCFCDANLK